MEEGRSSGEGNPERVMKMGREGEGDREDEDQQVGTKMGEAAYPRVGLDSGDQAGRGGAG